MEIRRLLQEIEKRYNLKYKESENVYQILTNIVILLEAKYNLQDDEIEKQLSLILKAI